jgi:hypothetical protein
MKYILNVLICLAVFLPFATTQAELTGEIIFRPPINEFNELWITNVDAPRKGRQFFKLERSPEALAVQTNGNLAVTTTWHNQIIFGNDIYPFE